MARSFGLNIISSTPNVFWYFWRRFFPDQETHSFSPESLANVDTVQFAAELAAIESVFDKPLALKAMLINWIIPFISSVLDKVLFVFMRRDPFYTIQSVLETREKFFADRTGWWSFKPKEYPQLVDRHPVTQVTGQIYYMNQAVTQGLGQISSDRQLHVSYRDFCQDPGQVHQHLREKLAGLGHEIPANYFGPSSFEQRDSVRISEDDRCRIIESYSEFSGVELAPTQGAVGV